MGCDGVNTFDGKHWLLWLSYHVRASKALSLLGGDNTRSFGLSCLIGKTNERIANSDLCTFWALHLCPAKVTAHGSSIHWHNSQSWVAPDTICNTPTPSRVGVVTRNSFKNRRLAPQITISLSGVLRPRSHAAWETSQEVAHPKIAPQQAHLTVEFMCTFGDISSHFDPFKPHSGCYITSTNQES